jgi:two-component system, NarL family, nitrate/nitrite response regulator NarL
MSSAEQPDPVTVVVVEDHALFRQAICRILSKDRRIKVIGVADSGDLGVSYAKERRPDVVLTDLRMRGLRGVELTKIVVSSLPEVRVIALTVSEEQEDLLEALRVGARGYVVKSVAQAEIVNAILAVARGESWLSPRIAGKLIDEYARLPSTVVRESLAEQPDLTARERSVLARLAQGMTNREIAQALDIGETTVKTHVKNLLEKLKARNRLEAAAVAFRFGLTTESSGEPPR